MQAWGKGKSECSGGWPAFNEDVWDSLSEETVSEMWPDDKKTAILGEDHCRWRGACEGQEGGALWQKQDEPQSY